MEKDLILSALHEGKMRVEGQFLYGSNYTFLGICQFKDLTLKTVYKPLKGERPLWDFPPHTLARREVAAYLVSEGLGWEFVPATVFRTKNAPMGPGSVQVFIEHEPEYHYFNFKEADQARLPQVMLFDLLINNADRKAGHLLIDPDGNLWLIDHGLSFHVEDKLRTVVWDHAGKPIPDPLQEDLENFIPSLSPGADFHRSLKPYLSGDEIDALHQRAAALLKAGTFPLPPEDRRAYPWPLV